MLLCFLSVTFWQCQKEDDLQDGRHFGPNLKRSKVNVLTGQKALEIKSLLDFEYNKGRKVAKNPSYALREYNYTIDYSKIIEVIDTLGNTNYTFKIENHPDQEATNFFNLVLSVKTDGSTIKLVEYQMDEEFYTAYQNGEKDILDFEGTINFYTISTTDPCPPDDTPITTNPSTGGGGSNGGTSGTGSTGDGGSGGGSGGGQDVPVFASIYYSCNSCSFSADSWNEFSTHTDEEGTIYPFTIVIKLGRSPEPIQPNPSDPCPPPDEEFGVILDESNPCEELEDLINNDTIKSKIEILKQEVNTSSNEKGYSFKKNPSGNYSSDYIEGEASQLSFYIGGDYFAGAHIHTAKGFDFFSFTDLWHSIKYYEKSSPENESESTLMLISNPYLAGDNINVYAIKIKKFNEFKLRFYQTVNSMIPGDNLTIDQKIYRMDLILGEQYKKIKDQNKQIAIALLKLIKKDQIGIYKANSTLTNWSEMTTLNNELIEQPCN